jgi:hypothetical protein
MWLIFVSCRVCSNLYQRLISRAPFHWTMFVKQLTGNEIVLSALYWNVSVMHLSHLLSILPFDVFSFVLPSLICNFICWSSIIHRHCCISLVFFHEVNSQLQRVWITFVLQFLLSFILVSTKSSSFPSWVNINHLLSQCAIIRCRLFSLGSLMPNCFGCISNNLKLERFLNFDLKKH